MSGIGSLATAGHLFIRRERGGAAGHDRLPFFAAARAAFAPPVTRWRASAAWLTAARVPVGLPQQVPAEVDTAAHFSHE
jgi:hypothetical protein